MATEKAFYSSVAMPGHPRTGNEIGGILDMLRYDVATVSEVHADYVIVKTPRMPTPDRWRSFGLWIGGTFGPVGPERVSAAIESATIAFQCHRGDNNEAAS